MASRSAEDLLTDRRINAVFGWLLVAFLCVVATQSFLAGDLAWTIFVLNIVALCLVAPVAVRNPEVMLPAELIGVAALPTFGHVITTLESVSDVTVYVSVAAVALILVVQFDLFTTVEMTVGFAIVFVAFTTLAAAGSWAVLRWAMDITLGTNILLKPGVSTDAIHDELMMEFVYSAVAGVVAGVVFEVYFRRLHAGETRSAVEVEQG